MQVLDNNKGKGIYASKDYHPWNIIYSEKPLFECCTLVNDEYVGFAKNKLQKERFLAETQPDDSFQYNFFRFMSTFPNYDLEQKHPELKFAMILLNSIKYDQVKGLSKTHTTNVLKHDIKKAAKINGITTKEMEDIIRVVKTNKFEINGLFNIEIGTSLFENTSFLNHSCNPNAFALVICGQVIIFARHEIKAGEEITIPYKFIYREKISQRLGFTCKCNHCDELPKIPDSFFEELEKLNSKGKIDLLITKCITTNDISLATGYIQLLFEYYQDLWRENETYREDALYSIVINREVQPGPTWILLKFIAMGLAFKRNNNQDLEKIMKELNFLFDTKIMDHIKICIYTFPHIYHIMIAEALGWQV